MKNRLKRLIGFLLVVAGISPAKGGDDWAQLGVYEKENASVTERGDYPEAVFMGNSITEVWRQLHPDFFEDNKFAGRGISGQTSYQMLLRFRDDVINLRPRFVIINAGTNDIAENNHSYDEDRTLGNIISMAELALAADIQPVLSAVLPAKGFHWRKTIGNVPEKIKSLNAKIKEYALSRGLMFIDYHTPMADKDDGLRSDLTKDGVHPNSKGYDIMETTLRDSSFFKIIDKK